MGFFDNLIVERRGDGYRWKRVRNGWPEWLALWRCPENDKWYPWPSKFDAYSTLAGASETTKWLLVKLHSSKPKTVIMERHIID